LERQTTGTADCRTSGTLIIEKDDGDPTMEIGPDISLTVRVTSFFHVSY
jgi:hypothetical protein